MRLIDEHWIAYPEFSAGSLRFFERLKLKLVGRPVVRYLDVILPRADLGRRRAILSRAGCRAGTFVLLVPGGGTGHPGADDAVGQFTAAARTLAARGVPTVYVGPTSAGADRRTSGGSAATGQAGQPKWHPLGPLPQAPLTGLMRSARSILANGGSHLQPPLTSSPRR